MFELEYFFMQNKFLADAFSVAKFKTVKDPKMLIINTFKKHQS